MTGVRDRLTRLARMHQARLSIPMVDRRIDVLDLVTWVYRDQQAHIVDGRGIGLSEGEKVAQGLMRIEAAGSGSCMASFEEIMRLGCNIQRQGRDIGELHPVAESVHMLVAGLQLSFSGAGALIVTYAKNGQLPEGADLKVDLEPDWKMGAKWTWVNVTQPDGSVRQERWPMPKSYKLKYSDDRDRLPVACLMRENFGADYLEAERAEYLAWHDALVKLVVLCLRLLKDQPLALGGLLPEGPAQPKEPWLEPSAGWRERIA